MDDFLIQSNYRKPIITTNIPSTPAAKTAQTESGASFADLLSNQLQANSNIAFSKHAFTRIVERNIDVSPSKLARLEEGMKLAQDKGLKDPLILVDSTAFIVNVLNNKVITTVNQDSLHGSVFTNIDGTVII